VAANLENQSPVTTTKAGSRGKAVWNNACRLPPPPASPSVASDVALRNPRFSLSASYNGSPVGPPASSDFFMMPWMSSVVGVLCGGRFCSNLQATVRVVHPACDGMVNREKCTRSSSIVPGKFLTFSIPVECHSAPSNGDTFPSPGGCHQRDGPRSTPRSRAVFFRLRGNRCAPRMKAALPWRNWTSP